MRRQELITAVYEAEKFLRRAKMIKSEKIGSSEYIPPGRDSAALRRQSMELTRSLADLRKS